jgi:pimeloyl-ACP methyl ester carboxylesterase
VTFARARRRLLQAAAILFFLALAGATYQGVATALERRQFPHPGQLADVGGHQLHLYCTGDGTPTVILEAPAAGMSAAWARVQPAVAEETRVCSYDRSGLGWSEAGGRPFEPAAVAAELDALLEKAGERGPYVLAGQGFGAALARLEAERLGSRAVALVLIDPPNEGNRSRYERTARVVTMSPWLARTGMLRASKMLSEQADGMPEPWSGALRSFLNRPDHLTRAGNELQHWNETIALAARATLPDGLAVVEVPVTPPSGVGFLADAGDAAAVTRAILGSVAAARAPTK